MSSDEKVRLSWIEIEALKTITRSTELLLDYSWMSSMRWRPTVPVTAVPCSAAAP